MTHTPDSKAAALVALRSHLDAAEEAIVLARNAANELGQYQDGPAISKLAKRTLRKAEASSDAIRLVIRDCVALINASKPKPSLAIVGGRDLQQYQRLDVPHGGWVEEDLDGGPYG